MSIKKILVSQAAPSSIAPYQALTEKYGAVIDFVKFSQIIPLSSIEMRAQHCNPLDYTAVVFSSRSTIDAYFKTCEDLRVKVPEGMKYFCTNEKVAMYLQKHIVYRKRKIFFGNGTPASVLELITAKHKGENFLIVTSDSPVSSMTKAFDETQFKHNSIVFARTVPCDFKTLDIKSYDVLLLYNKYDVAALMENFPDYKADSTIIIAYGSESLKKAAADAGLTISLSGPTPECPSATAAMEMLLKSKK